MNNSETITALSKTPKGRLKYDDGDPLSISQILNKCTSPPALSARAVQQIKTDDQANESNEISPNNNDDGGTFSWKRQENGSRVRRSFNESQANLSFERILQDFEHMWTNKQNKGLLLRLQQFAKEKDRLQQEGIENFRQLVIDIQLQNEATLQASEMQEAAKTNEMKWKHSIARKRDKEHAELLDSKLQAAQQKQQEEEQRRRERDEKNREHMISLGVQLQAIEQTVTKMVGECTHTQYLTETVRNSPDLMTQICNKANQLIDQSRQSSVTDHQLNVVSDLFSEASKSFHLVKAQVDAANKKGAEETAKLAEEKQQQQQQKQQEELEAQQRLTQQQQQESNVAVEVGITSESQKDDVQRCSEEAIKIYEGLQQKLTAAEKAEEQFVTNNQWKSYKFELQKTINTTVNAIAPTSSTHLRDKMQRICALLSGNHVTIGGKRVSANQHPAAIGFCKNLFAKKIVKQGNQQVASNYESAFAIAAVAVGVWCEFPDVGDLILAHFHRECPYLVPYHPAKQADQSNEDYYKCLGYTYDSDGVVEKHDYFLRRMSGVMRLYAALMFTRPPPAPGSRTSPPHPHGLEHAWAWLARACNIPPWPSVTATITHDLLQVCAAALSASYGRQFNKLLEVVRTGLLSRLRQVEPQGASGPITRLETFLTTNRFCPPEGCLRDNFWHT